MVRQLILLAFGILITASLHAQKTTVRKLKKNIAQIFSGQPGLYALACKDLQTGKTIYINEHEIFHAASTMKTPVLIEAYRQAADGKLAMTDSVTIINEFKSIADTSHFSLSVTDDSEPELYKQVGQTTTLYHLLYQMIIYSSNLATNIVIEKLGAANVMATIRKMGAHDIQVLRGVEDNKAFEKGMNNVVSAYDLCLLFEKMAKGEAVSTVASQEMTKILLDQKFNDIIPAKLPSTVKVAHKTGWIKGIHHDSGIVFLPDGRKYVLVLLSKNVTDEKAGVAAMATVSEMIYQYSTGK